MTAKEFINIKLIDTEAFDLTIFGLITIIILVIGTIISVRLLRRLFKRLEKKGTLDKGSSHSIFLILKYIIWVAIIGLILESVGVKLTLLIAGSAALLVGLGLGIQQIFNDVASGVLLLFERTLKVSDIVEIEDNIIGRVIHIGLRASKIETRDNVIIIVPNSKFISENVINWSHIESKTRFNVDIDVARTTDTDKVKEILFATAYAHEDVAPTPPPFVRFTDFGESSLHFQIFFWTDKSFEVENTKSDLRFAINKAFRDNNITIPYQVTDINIKSQD